MCFWYWCRDIFLIFHTNSVRSSQSGSWNLFIDNANKPSFVTLAFVNYFQFSANKGSKIWSHNVWFDAWFSSISISILIYFRAIHKNIKTFRQKLQSQYIMFIINHLNLNLNSSRIGSKNQKDFIMDPFPN